MNELDQKLLDFGISESFDENDYYVSKSNYFAKNILETWPQWGKKIVNLTGEKYSGKTHLSTIFKIKSNALYLGSKNIENSTLKNIKLSNSIIIEDLDNKFDEISKYLLSCSTRLKIEYRSFSLNVSSKSSIIILLESLIFFKVELSIFLLSKYKALLFILNIVDKCVLPEYFSPVKLTIFFPH